MSQSTRSQQLSHIADLILSISREISMRQADAATGVELTNIEGAVLRFIDRNPGCSPSEAAAGTGLQRSNLSAAGRRLNSLGLVTRKRDPIDHRSSQLNLTTKAREHIAAVKADWSVMMAGVFDDTDDLGPALALLSKMEHRFGELRNQKPMERKLGQSVQR